MRLAFAFTLFFAAGCKDTDTICEPTDMGCFCRERPADPACSDVDAGRPDGSVDGGRCGTMCDAVMPYCDEATETCVECIEPAHCTTAPRTVCVDHACVECAMDSDCTDLARPRCDTGTGMCIPCSSSDECMGRGATTICALDGPNAGSCVECTEVEADSCTAGHPCNPVTNVCSAFETNRRTCETCDTDANCMVADSACIPLEFMSAPRGAYCLPLAAGGCSRPFSTRVNGASLSGLPTMEYCGIRQDLTTCDAVRALGLRDCDTTMTAADCADAGAICTMMDTVANQCSYPCTAPTECPDGLTCVGGECNLP